MEQSSSHDGVKKKWKVIAEELSQEKDPARILVLAKQLNEAIVADGERETPGLGKIPGTEE